MTYILPNYFIEKKNEKVQGDNLFYVEYSSKDRNKNIDVRITTHCMIILQEGIKILHLKEKDIKVHNKELLRA